MGLIRRSHKIYLRPTQKWDKTRIAEESMLVKTFGLKNKKEIYVAQRIVKKIRDAAKRLIAQKNPKEEIRFLNRIKAKGYVPETATLGDVLDITVENVLSRRLQTVVFKRKLAKTIKQARQYVTHRKIKVKNTIISIPSYSVTLEEEKQMAAVVVGKPQLQNSKKVEIKQEVETSQMKQKAEDSIETQNNTNVDSNKNQEIKGISSEKTQEIKEVENNA